MHPSGESWWERATNIVACDTTAGVGKAVLSDIGRVSDAPSDTIPNGVDHIISTNFNVTQQTHRT